MTDEKIKRQETTILDTPGGGGEGGQAGKGSECYARYAYVRTTTDNDALRRAGRRQDVGAQTQTVPLFLGEKGPSSHRTRARTCPRIVFACLVLFSSKRIQHTQKQREDSVTSTSFSRSPLLMEARPGQQHEPVSCQLLH